MIMTCIISIIVIIIIIVVVSITIIVFLEEQPRAETFGGREHLLLGTSTYLWSRYTILYIYIYIYIYIHTYIYTYTYTYMNVCVLDI